MAADTKDQALDLVAAIFVRAGKRLTEERPARKVAAHGAPFTIDREAA